MDEYIKLLGYIAASLFFFMALMLLLTLRQGARVRGAAGFVEPGDLAAS